MRQAGIPTFIINVVLFLYSEQDTLFVMNGEVVATVCIGRGVKQGCPLSGSLFALAVDPLLRRLAQGPGPLDQGTFAYADDLALVLRLLREGLARLLPIFRRWARISGLRLRPDKRVVVPLGGQSQELVADDLQDAGEEASEMKVGDSARYLGVLVGPARTPRSGTL